MMSPDALVELSDMLDRETKDMEKHIVLGTKEQWSALLCLRDAAANLRSAAAWLSTEEATPR